MAEEKTIRFFGELDLIKQMINDYNEAKKRKKLNEVANLEARLLAIKEAVSRAV